ncbi:MFS transporter [Amycolatopsis samaneae]|uniref:MFS transporter n=1 Tax=Amycolatopsis samaneae TaxID=664691 RepID=A0ABW5GXZ3_9PSEU
MSTVRERVRHFLPWLLTASMVEWIGTGVFVTASTVYFVRFIGLTPTSVGVGLSLAGAVALLAAVPLGALSDAWGTRRVLILINVCRAAATLCYPLVGEWWGFLGLTTIVIVTETAAIPLTQAAVGERTTEETRTTVMGAQRTVLNIGMSIGGLIAAAAVATGSEVVYHWLFVADALTFGVAALLLSRLAPVPGRAGAKRPSRLAVFRDRRLLAIACYDAVLTLWLPILNVALPVWLATRTDAPVGLFGVLYAVNTITCVLLQVPVSARIRSIMDSWRSYAASGVFLATACACFAIAPLARGTGTVVLLALSVLATTAGELCQVSAAWTLSFNLAPPAERAQYLSGFGLGRAAATRLIGPVLLTGAVIALGPAGWVLLAAVFAGATVIAVVVRRRVAHTGPVPKSSE